MTTYTLVLIETLLFTGVFEMPAFGTALSPIENPIPLTVVLDGIQEPRELGGLLHTASTVRSEQIITTKGKDTT